MLQHIQLMMNAHCEHEIQWNSDNYFYIFAVVNFILRWLANCLSFTGVHSRLIHTVFGAVRSFNIFVTWTHRSSIFQNQTDHLSMGHLFSFNLKKYWHTQKKEHRPIKWQCLRLNGLFTMIYTCIGDWVKDSRKSQTKITAHFRSHNVY